MKRINEYKKLFNVDKDTDLKTLKKSYRNLVKEWHPDKFQEGDTKAIEAEGMSRKIIDGYHFLVGIAPETKAAKLDEFAATTSSGISEMLHEGQVLEITFVDGATYEFFGVDKKLFNKLLEADKQTRFGKRKIFNAFLYRKLKKELQQE